MEFPVSISVALLLLLVVATSELQCGLSEPVEDKRALLEFIGRIPHRQLNWSNSTSACTRWIGVSCNADETRVIAVRLPGIALTGEIPSNTLSRLSALQILSLRSNMLTGIFPPDFVNLGALTDLHLQFNRFYGPLPSDFSKWRNLTAVDLSFNQFNRTIPSSLSNLTNLTALNLSNNSFNGEIPDLCLPNLIYLNLSNNQLVGPIPRSLQNFLNSSFFGNNLTLITSTSPLPSLPSSSPPPPLTVINVPAPKKKLLTESAILATIVSGCALIFVALAVFLILCFKNRQKQNSPLTSGKPPKSDGDRSPEKAVTLNQRENNRLVFFEGCTFAFDLEDLLRASAEVLGKGTFGTAYKAALEDSTTVVVKRLKDIGVGKREFEQQMEIVGKIKHENVVELRAYYYSKDEKLIVYDYHSLGSVSSLLHGKRREETTAPLDWESRIKIAIGAARGIAYIHTQNNARFIHGNIKSANVFLNHQLQGCVADLGLATLTNPMISPISRTAGYRAPEITDTRKATQKSDVYSFGVLLLELLTGKSPIQVVGGGDEIVHLVRWVQSVVREEWTAEVFDLELMRNPNIEEELVEMLQIAMACVVRIPEHRPKMSDVAKLIQDVRRPDTGTRPSSETSSVTTPARGQQHQGTTSAC